MQNLEEVREIRNRLKLSWIPFFAMHGRLTEIQVQAIPKILDQKNIIIASPTASGKTEAVVAPVAELFRSTNFNALGILYIVPTRALANDMFERLAGPLGEMGIYTVYKHGDHPSLGAKTPNCLITTPESLDSLICRKPLTFSRLFAVIVDEIHLLDNTYRGDQLRILLRRLESISEQDFHTHLLSATLADPFELSKRYVSDFEVVKVEGQREINWMFAGSPSQVCEIAKGNNWKKMLVFCNYRKSVERLGAEFGPLWKPYPTVVHHGSLSKQVREEAEKVMNGSSLAICVATSTLEIGIDIGDIDAVVLAEPPYSISGLLQRIGRGNRKKNYIQVICLTDSQEERDILAAMLSAAQRGELPVSNYTPDLSVVVQQIFSLLFQFREGRTHEFLMQIMSPIVDSDVLVNILQIVSERGWIEWRGGRWYAQTRLIDEGEKGRIHSNIPDNVGFTVLDVDSGRTIGEIGDLFDQVFSLGQRNWTIISRHGNVISARRINGPTNIPAFKRVPHDGKYSSFIRKLHKS